MINDKNFDKYFKMYENARKLERSGNVYDALDIYFEILKKYNPIGTVYYERPAIILEKLKRFNEAKQICDRAIKAIENGNFRADSEEFEKRKERLLRKQNKSSSSAKKERTTNIVSKDLVLNNNNLVITKEDWFNNLDWYISISFQKSSSQNFQAALHLARNAPLYKEFYIDDKIIYQAFYTKEPEEFIKYLKLFELVSNWKSCHVIINGKLVDRKVIGQINYCYGDKCRIGKSDFCFGASGFTQNIFGCHRARMHEMNDPWYSFGNLGRDGIFYINKNEIEHELKHRLKPFELCPSLDIDSVLNKIHELPNTINPKKDKNWDYCTYMRNGITINGVRPVQNSDTITLTVNFADLNTKPKKKKGFIRNILNKFL